MARQLRQLEACTVYAFQPGPDKALERRIRGEYGEMPGLRLSPEQAARFWSWRAAPARSCSKPSWVRASYAAIPMANTRATTADTGPGIDSMSLSPDGVLGTTRLVLEAERARAATLTPQSARIA